MKLFGKDLSREVAVIAEIGVNHEGDVDVAAKLVAAAAEAKADAVKFQSYTPARYVSRSDRERFERVSRFSLNEAAHRRLAKEAERCGIAFISAAISEDWVPLLAELGPAVKIASGDLTFEPVIRAAAESGRVVILSTGGGTIEEVDEAVGWVRDVCGGTLAERLVLLHCVSLYPALIGQANLRAIPFLAERYGVAVGWSNHVIGSEACLAAVAVGARVVEVHVTDRKTGRAFRDHHLSFEPQDLADMVAAIGRVTSSLGAPTKAPQPEEIAILKTMRKGIVAACDITAGTVVQPMHLSFARPATEFTASELPQLIGAVATRAISSGELITRGAVRLKS